MESISSEPPKNSARLQFKRDLYAERSHGLNIPICPVCLDPLQFNLPIEAHEVLITKGDVLYLIDSHKELINSRYNVVLLHPTCHITAQHSPQYRQACAASLLLLYGYEPIVNWLRSLNLVVKGSQVVQAVRYLDAVIKNVMDLITE